jgi:hypothetical protein
VRRGLEVQLIELGDVDKVVFFREEAGDLLENEDQGANKALGVEILDVFDFASRNVRG